MLDIKNDNFSNLVLPETSRYSSGIISYICLIFLPTLIYVLTLLAYFDVIDYEIHLHTVIMMGILFFIALIFSKHNAFCACGMFESYKEEFKLKLKQYIMKNFLTIGKETKSNASFDDFSKNFLKTLRNEQYVFIASAVFPMVGILGTFISIAISMPNFNSTDTAGLESEISILLNGVSTAFYVSIYGIFLALWWMFFEKFGMSKFLKIINRQKNATQSFFWTKEEIEKKYTEQSLEHFEHIGYIFKHVSNAEFFKELDKSVDKKFKIFTQILNNEENAVRLSAETIKSTMNEVIKTQREQNDLAKTYTKITGAITTLNKNIENISFSFKEQYNHLLDLSNQKTNKLENNITELNNSISRLFGMLENHSKENINQQKALQNEFKSHLLEGIKDFKSVYDDEVRINYDELNTLKQDIKTTIEQTNATLDKLDENSKPDESIKEN